VHDMDASSTFIRETPTSRGTPCALVIPSDLLGTGSAMPHADVLANMTPYGSTCQGCRRIIDHCDLRTCDETYPTNAGLLFPEGGDGRQFKCHRGRICTDCESDMESSEEKWFCAKCLAGPDCLNDVWGSGICEGEPTYFIAPGSKGIHSINLPSLSGSLLDEATCERFHRDELERILRRTRALRACGSGHEGQQRVTAAVEFLRAVRISGLTRGDLERC